MQPGSLVVWNGESQARAENGVKLLEKDVIYTVVALDSALSLKLGLKAPFLLPTHASLAEMANDDWYAMSLLREVDPPQEIDIEAIIEQPEMA